MYDKVETIGDAYMVASGIPIPNGQHHAVELSKMALDLLAKVLTFEIKHKPNHRLKLRMGMHSGQVVGGVVGSKIPHYSVGNLFFRIIVTSTNVTRCLATRWS